MCLTCGQEELQGMAIPELPKDRSADTVDTIALAKAVHGALQGGIVIVAATPGTLNPTSMSGENRLRRANDDTTLLLFRRCIKYSSSFEMRALVIDSS